ncbi:hypothetical protein ABW19_dt0209437 [Dactylella cylindrospora]|nr:hypothetical protein ABW19_dt0209437 [Dactylella cylindrospora]
MRCSFLSKDLPYIVPVLLQDEPNFAVSRPASTAASSTASSSPASTPFSKNLVDSQEQVDPYMVNMAHLELFNNLLSEEFLSLEDFRRTDVVPVGAYMRYAFTEPYLMHQALAISALHLSTKAVESRGFYRGYAIGLQNRALSLFSVSNPVMEVTPANCVHMYLFSSLVSAHLLCDALHYQRDSLEGFIDRFTHDLSIYRGVRAVLGQFTELMRETEVAPSLKISQLLLQLSEANGPECNALRDLLDTLDAASPSQRIYKETVLHLQQVFDAQREGPGDKPRMPAVFGWPILVSPEYVDLLRQKEAVALVILAHYAVLLHRGQDLWIFGEGGRFLIESISEFLGPRWQQWLKYPKSVLKEGLAD